MRKLLILFCIVAASITAGNCIICMECSNKNGLDCVGEIVTCGTCMTIVGAEKVGVENTTYYVKRTCALNPEACNSTFSVSSGKFETYAVSSCCDTDYCNNQTVQAPPQNITESGIECPSCQLINGESCEANGTVRCRGSETKCLTFTGKYNLHGACLPVALQGCVTENNCGNADQYTLQPFVKICGNSTTQCFPGNTTSTVLQ